MTMSMQEALHEVRVRAGHLAAVESEAVSLMHEHGLTGWTFAWDRARQRAGVCRYAARTISLSQPLMARWPVPECRDTILHEIAHALTPGHNHDRAWQAMCRKIGARPERCWSPFLPSLPQASTVPAYTGTCPQGHEIRRHRLSARAPDVSCSVCAPRYDERYRFTWRRNDTNGAS